MPTTRTALWLSLPVLVAIGGRADAGINIRPDPRPIPFREVYSPNGRFVLAVNATEAGSVVYATADRSRPVWTIAGPLMSTWAHVVLSDDGNVVALVSDGPAESTAEGLRLVDRNGVVATYQVDEIAPSRLKVPDPTSEVFLPMCGPSVPAWAAGVTNQGDRFTIETEDGRNYTFGFTGEPVGRGWVRWAGIGGVVGVVIGGLALVVWRHRSVVAVPGE